MRKKNTDHILLDEDEEKDKKDKETPITEVKNHYKSILYPYDETLKVGDFVKNSNQHRNSKIGSYKKYPVTIIAKIIKLYSRDYREANPLAVLKIIYGNEDHPNFDVHWLTKLTQEEASVEGL